MVDNRRPVFSWFSHCPLTSRQNRVSVIARRPLGRRRLAAHQRFALGMGRNLCDLLGDCHAACGGSQ